MQCFTHKIKTQGGIHVRQAGMIAKLEREFQSSIEISDGIVSVMANRPTVLLGLKMKRGDSLIITIHGEDEEIAAEKVKTFLNKNL